MPSRWGIERRAQARVGLRLADEYERATTDAATQPTINPANGALRPPPPLGVGCPTERPERGPERRRCRRPQGGGRWAGSAARDRVLETAVVGSSRRSDYDGFGELWRRGP